MKKIIFKTVLAFFLLTLISGYLPASVSAQVKDNDETFGRIVYINQAKGFVVFNLGKEDGVKKGSVFEVYRDGIKTGEIEAVKVRNKFSAADIEWTYQNAAVRVDDTLRASKEISAIIRHAQGLLLLNEQNRLLAQAQKYLKKEKYEQAEEKVFQVLELDPENEKALKILSRIEQETLLKEQNRLLAQAQKYLKKEKYEQAEEKIRYILELNPENEKALKMLSKIKWNRLHKKVDGLLGPAQAYLEQMDYEQAEERIRYILELEPKNEKALKMLSKLKKAARKIMGMEPGIVLVDINAPKKNILPVIIDVLKKYGCLITSSDPAEYNLQAAKNIKLPFMMGLISEGGAFTRNKICYTIELKESPKLDRFIINRLTIYLKGVYDREGRVYSHRIRMSSPIYKEVQEMALRIKYLSENI